MSCFGRNRKRHPTAEPDDDGDNDSDDSGPDEDVLMQSKFQRMCKDPMGNFLSLVPMCAAHPEWAEKIDAPLFHRFLMAELGQEAFFEAHKVTSWTINEELGAPYEAGTCLLHVVSRAGHVRLVERALALGADHTARNTYGECPLFLAASYGHADVVACLRTAGADVNQTNSLGEAPIYAAAYRGHLAVIKELLADPSINYLAKTDEGTTALFASIARGHTEVSDYLREWSDQRRLTRQAELESAVAH